MRRTLALSLLLLALPATASAAGGPVAGLSAGGDGVTTPGSPVRFVAVPSGRHQTVLLRIWRANGRVVRSRTLDGTWIVPAVAGDATGTGLSADGATLVLAQPRLRYPIRRSRFQVLDARTLRPQRQVKLRGDFTLDAVSPDAGLLYLVHYPSADITHYVVRAYDMAARRLRATPVVDPDEADEPMRGSPLARVVSEDGRWAYTLYDGNGAHPFVHALDTSSATAVCVDLDQLGGRDDLWSMRLRTGANGAVVVQGDAGPILTVDPHSFAVRDATLSAPAPRPARDDGDGGISALAIGAIAAALALVAAAAMLARRGRPRVGSA
jgi:hypothetical protein